MQTTENLGLGLIERDDPVGFGAINDNMTRLDAALSTAATAADTAQATAEAAQATATEAANTAGVALTRANTLTAALGSTGKNVRAVSGTYTGTGSYNSANTQNSLNIPFEPLLVFINDNSSGKGTVLIKPATKGLGGSPGNVIWGDRKVSWHDGSSAVGQLNVNGRMYYYTALGYDT